MTPCIGQQRILIGLVFSWAASACLVLGAEAPSPWRVTQTAVVDAEAWRWNWASWDQDKIATAGDFQYTVFWDADGVFVLARRDLRNNRVQTLRLPDFKLSNDDAHRNTCLGISPQDGRLHLSWDHHNDPLRYARSRAGFLTNPPPQISAGGHRAAAADHRANLLYLASDVSSVLERRSRPIVPLLPSGRLGERREFLVPLPGGKRNLDDGWKGLQRSRHL